MKKALTGRIFDIKRFAVHDGPGIRTTLFFKGCPLGCWWCHNPEGLTQQIISSNKIIKLQGVCLNEMETIGTDYTVESAMTEILKDQVFYDESGGGVTLSGGEPLDQLTFLTELLNSCRSEGIHTAIDTCGYIEPLLFREIIDLTDLFLYDLKLIDDALHMKFTGVSNQIILKNLEVLVQLEKPIIIRFPLIPGITDTENNLNDVESLLRRYRPVIREISLLPYHPFAKKKYERLKIENKMPIDTPGKNDNMALIQARFQALGLTTSIGG